MYRKKIEQPEFMDFYHPFGGRLRSDNRWVKLSKIIPWDEIEKKYEKMFSTAAIGAPAKTSRVAFGALFIREKLKLTDEETVEQIIETPYLQYFLGYESYYDERPFDPSLMVYFRKRIGRKFIGHINEIIYQKINKQKKKNEENIPSDKNEDNKSDPPNQGELIFDATCTPADIRYPNDLSILNEARKKCEEIIDILHEPLKGKESTHIPSNSKKRLPKSSKEKN